MTQGEFILKLKDWNIHCTDGSVSGTIVLKALAGTPYAVAKKRNDEEVIPDEVWHSLLHNLEIDIDPKDF